MYGKSPEKLYASISSVSDHPVMGGNGLSRPGGNLGFRV